MELQVTIVSEKYKPVSTIVKIPMSDVVAKNFAPYRKLGVQKICNQRRWTTFDLKEFGYNTVKIRIYDKEKIEADKKAKYEQIKREKFASGEWKPSKKDIAKGLTE